MINSDNWCFENIISDVKSYDEIFECIIDEWRSFATLSLDEKRDARFNFLCKLQRIFTEYDSDITKRIIIALSCQCHGVEYEYEIHNSFAKLTDEIKITCRDHGSFKLRLIDHLLAPKGLDIPRGCQSCLVKQQSRSGRKYSTNVFIAKAEAIHGSKFDYRHVIYLGNEFKIDIGCVACRNSGREWMFKQRAKRHLLGKGCATCAIMATRMTFNQAVEKSKAVHGNTYEYLEILPPDKLNKGQRIQYRCKQCNNVHTQLINMHVSGKCGCPICGRKLTGLKNEVPYEDIIKQAKKVHGDKYQYIGYSYTESGGKQRRCLDFICNNCGITGSQRVEAHLHGHGCKNCNYGGMDRSKEVGPMTFYFLRLVLPKDLHDTDVVYKVGVTNRTANQRLAYELPGYVRLETVVEHQFVPGGNAYILEQELLFIFRKQYQYRGDFRLIKCGNGELFVKEGYNDILNMIEQFIADNH